MLAHIDEEWFRHPTVRLTPTATAEASSAATFRSGDLQLAPPALEAHAATAHRFTATTLSLSLTSTAIATASRPRVTNGPVRLRPASEAAAAPSGIRWRSSALRLLCPAAESDAAASARFRCCEGNGASRGRGATGVL